MQTPPLRVSRPVSACSRCRAAKIRCDGKLPACTACERAGKSSECTSGNDQFARGKERSYVASLETRIEKLERQLQYRQQSGQPVITLRRQFLFPETKISKKVEASDVDELVSDFGHLAVNATSNGYHGFDREMSLARLLLSTAMVNDLPQAREHPLPTRAVAIDLLHACMANFLTLCPIMSFTAALGALERVYHHSGRLASPQDIWNVRLCLAMGLSSRSKANGDPQYESAIRHVSVAVDTVGETTIAPGSLARVRGLMLLVLFSTANPAHLNAWYLMGMAARFMAEMGLHATTGTETPERRALFLLGYSMDRYISMSRLRPFSFSDDSADLTLPSSLTPQDVLTNKELTRCVAVFGTGDDYAKVFVQIHQEQSLWYQTLFFTDHYSVQRPYTTRLDTMIDNNAWLTRIPQSAKGPLRSRFMVQILYGSVLLILPSDTSLRDCSVYGKALALEYICFYADAIEGLAGTESTGLAKDDDFLRTLVVGRRLLQIVMDTTGPLYVVPGASRDDLDVGTRLPGLTWTVQGDAVRIVIAALRKLDSAMEWFTVKFGHANDHRDWKMESKHAWQPLAIQPI